MYHPDRSAHRSGAVRAAKCTRSGHRHGDDPQQRRALSEGRNATAIYQDLVEHHGYSGSYDAVKRFVRNLRKREPKVSCRFETEPGQEMQVDYGEAALTRDPRTGKYRRPRLFTLALGNSRHAFQKAVWNSSTEIWCRLHEEGFAYFGGAAHTNRFDNLKEGVIKPDVYDPQLNALYAKLLEHYGVVPLPLTAMIRARASRLRKAGAQRSK
jgi:transposase